MRNNCRKAGHALLRATCNSQKIILVRQKRFRYLIWLRHITTNCNIYVWISEFIIYIFYSRVPQEHDAIFLFVLFSVVTDTIDCSFWEIHYVYNNGFIKHWFLHK